MGFIAIIYDSRGRRIAKHPEEFHKAYATRQRAEVAAERHMTELGKTKKHAGKYLRPEVRYVDVHALKDLL